MFNTGIHPFTKEEVCIARGLKDRKMQQALMQFFNPENYFQTRSHAHAASRIPA